jgi:hypothetical protein
MEARDSNGRLARAASIGLWLVLLVGLWQAYGQWLLSKVRAHVF